MHQTQAANNQQRVQLLLIEAQLLREAKRWRRPIRCCSRFGEAAQPSDLLYETAMLATGLASRMCSNN